MTKEIAIKALIGNGETLNLPGTIKKNDYIFYTSMIFYVYEIFEMLSSLYEYLLKNVLPIVVGRDILVINITLY